MLQSILGVNLRREPLPEVSFWFSTERSQGGGAWLVGPNQYLGTQIMLSQIATVLLLGVSPSHVAVCHYEEVLMG